MTEAHLLTITKAPFNVAVFRIVTQKSLEECKHLGAHLMDRLAARGPGRYSYTVKVVHQIEPETMMATILEAAYEADDALRAKHNGRRA